MAIAYLNPDGSTSVNGWNTSFSTTPSHLSQGDTVNEWRTNLGATGKAIFTLDDFDFSGLNVDSITNIAHKLVIGLDARSGTAPVTIAIRDMSSGGAGTTLYSESHNNAAGAGFQTFTGTLRTTSDGSSAWTDSDLDNLGLFLTCAGGPFIHIVQQLYIKVTYVEVSGYGHKVIGVAPSDIGKVTGIATADIAKVIGVN
tara:strand:- start:1125 stop:1721 length:597 start_codon:yes stop_codon:yes gene_type:complete